MKSFTLCNSLYLVQLSQPKAEDWNAVKMSLQKVEVITETTSLYAAIDNVIPSVCYPNIW